MTQIVINHCGKSSNTEAMEACIKFALCDGYKQKRMVVTNNGQTFEVMEKEHPKQNESICSVIFDVTKQ